MTLKAAVGEADEHPGYASSIPPPGGHYTHAKVDGATVYVSGQLGIRADGSHTFDCSFEEQAKQALSNVANVLRSEGCSLHDVLKVTVYIVGVEHWASFNGIYAALFGDAKPARTVVPVPALHYGYLIEIDAIATKQPRSDE